MKRKSLLITTVGILALIGLTVASMMFARSMSPTAAAGASLPNINITQLKRGTFITQKSPYEGYFESKYLVLRDFDSKIYVYTVPLKDGQVLLPDIKWWRWGGLCDDFSPDTDGHLLKQGGVIQCQDKNRPDLGNSYEWKWKYSGENMGKYTSDMYTPKYTIEGNYIIIGKK